jgi:hypothetical protein
MPAPVGELRVSEVMGLPLPAGILTRSDVVHFHLNL